MSRDTAKQACFVIRLICFPTLVIGSPFLPQVLVDVAQYYNTLKSSVLWMIEHYAVA